MLAEPPGEGRNLVICCDGTNNQFGRSNTNVVRLVQVLAREPAKQLVYYDPGVGTLPEPSFLGKVRHTIERYASLAFGVGLTRNVEEAYAYLMDFWEPGDRVFLFGFSRGAYTVRVLAGMLHILGLLPRGNLNLVPYAMRLYGGIRDRGGDDATDGASRYWKLCNEFRWTFARPVDGTDQRHFPVHFLGVWDTVSSVGWVWDPAKYPFTAKNPSVHAIRHAVALDERRAFYRQNLFRDAGARQDLKELWFAGVHSDVGGGYPAEDGGLWRVSFEWMLNEARASGLHIHDERLEKVLSRQPAPKQPWAEPTHESLVWSWWPAEFFPKLQSRPGSKWKWPRLNLGRRRSLKNGALLATSTLQRIRDAKPAYLPGNLPSGLLDEIRHLPTINEPLAYRSNSGSALSASD